MAEDGRSKRLELGIAVIMLDLALLAFFNIRSIGDLISGWSQPSTTHTPNLSPSFPPPSPGLNKNQTVSKVAYLAQAERLCSTMRVGFPPPPDRRTDPQGFGRWLAGITTGNQQILDALVQIRKPVANESVLNDLFAV
jgi:hypothetical protein